MTDTNITLIDPSKKRRDAIMADFFSKGVSVESHSSVRELPAPRRCSGIFLVADDKDNVESVMDHLGASLLPCAVLAISDAPNIPSVVKAVKAGVTDYLSWPLSEEALLPAISAATRLVSLRNEVDRDQSRARLLVSKLTKRELEVIHAVSLGWTSREIAESLAISHRTVEIHRQHAIGKLDARNSSEAVRVLHHASNRPGV
jgi:FixJ family two-component response regulator